MALQEWELQQRLAAVLPLDERELTQIVSYVNTLPDSEATDYLNGLLGDSPEAKKFVEAFHESRVSMDRNSSDLGTAGDSSLLKSQHGPHTHNGSSDAKAATSSNVQSIKHDAAAQADPSPRYAPPSDPPPRASRAVVHHHTNKVIEAGKVRAQDEVRLMAPSQCCSS